jgi:hypothetical protein
MRIIFMVAVAIAALDTPASAQLVGLPSNQGGAAAQSPNLSSAPPTVSLTAPGSSDQLSTIPPQSLNGLPPHSLNGLSSAPISQGREQPERPAGPLR